MGEDSDLTKVGMLRSGQSAGSWVFKYVGPDDDCSARLVRADPLQLQSDTHRPDLRAVDLIGPIPYGPLSNLQQSVEDSCLLSSIHYTQVGCSMLVCLG